MVFPLIIINDNVELLGKLELNLDYRPINGDCLEILNAKSINGKFENVIVEIISFAACVKFNHDQKIIDDKQLQICFNIDSSMC